MDFLDNVGSSPADNKNDGDDVGMECVVVVVVAEHSDDKSVSEDHVGNVLDAVESNGEKA